MKVVPVYRRFIRESGAHLYTCNTVMSLCRKCRAVSGERHNFQAFFPRTGSKDSSTEGLFAKITVSLASFTKSRNHIFSGTELAREPASASKLNKGSMRDTLTKISLRRAVKETRMSAASACADL